MAIKDLFLISYKMFKTCLMNAHLQSIIIINHNCSPVSYTHLDVYKRQVCVCNVGVNDAEVNGQRSIDIS